jgi:transposase
VQEEGMLELSRSERSAVAEALRTVRERRHWLRLRGIWLAAAGVPVPEVAAHLGVGRSTVFDWLAHWRAVRDPAAMADAPRPGQPPRLDAAHRARLEALLADKPAAHGYRTTAWTVPLLHHHVTTVIGVALSATTLRRTLHALGYRWKRPRYVLARRDPEREGKKTCTGARGRARAAGGAEHRGAL